jgi:predicted Holliday junction resolvase-like endonuclease
MLIFLLFLVSILATLAVYKNYLLKKDIEVITKLQLDTVAQVQQEKQRNSDLVSKKVAADVRLGAISENLLPLLNGLPYNPKDLHHLAQPIDFIHFNYDKDDPSITFVEVKSGGAKESPRQKLIKKVIKEGKVFYDLVRINEQGIKVERKV